MDYRSLDEVLNKITLEQQRVENIVDRLDLEMGKLLNQPNNIQMTANERKNIANTCLEIAKKIRRYDTELNRIRDELNEDILRSKSTESKNDSSVNLILNNYYQTMCYMEYRLQNIQTEIEKIHNNAGYRN